jgi:hypothetical protein
MKVIHTYRTGNDKIETRKLTRSAAIKLFCQECMGWQALLVKDCPSKTCVLFPYRMGPGKIDADSALQSLNTTQNRMKC